MCTHTDIDFLAPEPLQHFPPLLVVAPFQQCAPLLGTIDVH